MKKLEIWNGRGYSCRNHDDPRWKAGEYYHVYVGAYSRADARRVIEKYCGYLPPDAEIKDYFSKGCWGNTMDGVERERGLWVEFNTGTQPIKVV